MSFILNIEKFYQNLFIVLFKNLLFRKIHKSNRILIFRTGSLGDSICALPAIYTIKQNYSLSEIDILTNTGGNHLVGLQSLINPLLVNKFIDYSAYSTLQLFKKIKGGKYDLVIELTQVNQPITRQIRNMLFFRLAGVKYGMGWERPITQGARKRELRNSIFERESERLLKMLSQNKLKIYPNEYPLNITNNDREIVTSLFAEKDILNKKKNIGIVIGAKRQQNRWPINYFNELINYLSLQSFNCIIIGGKEDQQLVQQLDSKNTVYDFTGKLTPAQSAVAFSFCSVAVSNDTGPMHLAYAVGTYVFAIFSSRDYPVLWYPPKELSQVFRNETIDCAVCFSETCSDNQCMKGIKPSEIIKAVKEYLKLEE